MAFFMATLIETIEIRKTQKEEYKYELDECDSVYAV